LSVIYGENSWHFILIISQRYIRNKTIGNQKHTLIYRLFFNKKSIA